MNFHIYLQVKVSFELFSGHHSSCHVQTFIKVMAFSDACDSYNKGTVLRI
jgi:hypothetical protein